MGTSKGYQPPKGYLWSDAKKAVTTMVKSNFENNSIGKAIGQYNQAAKQGGENIIRQGTLSSAGSKAANFFSVVSSVGLEKALVQANLSNLIGKSNKEIYIGLIDYFVGDGSSLNDSIARDSMAELMKEVFLDGSDDKNFEDIINALDMNKFIKDLITKFIQKDFIMNFSEKIEAKCKDLEEYKSAEYKIKNFIKTLIDEKYSVDELSSIDWNGLQGKSFIQEKCSAVLKIFEVYLGE